MSDARPTGELTLWKRMRQGGRTDRSPLGMWFWDIDRVVLLLTLLLIAVGLIAVGSA
ncbi:MAG: cell division protein FtsW, partial [Sphingomonas bacterium]|nr:cell division protein FtsW [Sphingomonas bacterium]